MAMKPLRPCRHPGCGVLVSGGYCAAHQPKRADRSEESKFWRWMYQTDAWKRLRSGQLLEEPFCRECAKRGLRTPATDVDYIRDHKGDWSIFTDRDNLESLCLSCAKQRKNSGKTQGKNSAVDGRNAASFGRTGTPTRKHA